jgi:archaemetzincin
MSHISECTHKHIQVTSSSHAKDVGFKRPNFDERVAAATRDGQIPALPASAIADAAKKTAERNRPVSFPHCFPAPLVLPGDDLALDPEFEPQSLLSWIDEEDRNPVTHQRRTVYVVGSPDITDEAAIMRQWAVPSDRKVRGGESNGSLGSPKLDDVREYLEAFYHGLPVKAFTSPFRFITWDDQPVNKASPFVGLALSDSCTRIRTRACVDRTFARQLCLTDILDALIENVPKDAYAILLLVDHDLYEEDEDGFCCGRAYGGSRVAVVSSARYHPDLDEDAEIEREHMWPTSHCADYLEREAGWHRTMNASQGSTAGQLSRFDQTDGEFSPFGPFAKLYQLRYERPHLTPIGKAVKKAHVVATAGVQGPEDMYGLWLSRVARTASHELGHCCGLDHCVYYACVMQGSGSLEEDGRQPPYLCHICLKKLTSALLEVKAHSTEATYVSERDGVLSEFCKKWEHVPMFAGFQVWLDEMIKWRSKVIKGQAMDSRVYESYPAPVYGTI